MIVSNIEIFLINLEKWESFFFLFLKMTVLQLFGFTFKRSICNILCQQMIRVSYLLIALFQAILLYVHISKKYKNGAWNMQMSIMQMSSFAYFWWFWKKSSIGKKWAINLPYALKMTTLTPKEGFSSFFVYFSWLLWQPVCTHLLLP